MQASLTSTNYNSQIWEIGKKKKVMFSVFWAIVGIGAIVFALYNELRIYGKNHSEWIENRMKGRNAAQQAAVKYFCYETGCLFNRKITTDFEYDEMVSYLAKKFDYRKKALEKIGLDEDQLKEIDPVHFEGYLFDKSTLSKQGQDNKWRSSKYQISWLFFSSTQLYVYQYTFNLDEDGKKEATEEYFYKDITNFSTSSDTVEVSVYNKSKDINEVVNVDSNRFAITVPGDKFYCSLEQSDYTERAIQGMKALLRDKKNS